jgi:hypothetical protein
MADAKAKEVNKSAEIRKVATSMKAKGEKPRPVTIIATLKKQGIEVSSPQVSMVLKRMGFRPQRRRKAGKAKAAAPRVATGKKVIRAKAPTTISVDDLLAAKKVAEKFGSADNAIKVLEALKRFEG